MNNFVRVTRSGEIAVITIDNPPLNAISPGVPEGLIAAIDELERDAALKAAIVMGAGRTFIAGADIKEFNKITSGQKARGDGLHPLLSRIENCAKPIVIAIHGNALGGGLELAMAGHYRIATPDAQLG